MKILLFALLLIGFGLLFYEGRLEIFAKNAYVRARIELETVARQRNLHRRNNLRSEERSTYFSKMEQRMYYNGVKLRFPHLTAELWVAMHMAVIAGGMVIGTFFFVFADVLFVLFVFGVIERWILQRMRGRNLRVVNEELSKFLDFLGNYSVSSGEITGVFLQISRYLKPPLCKVLENCYYEAQTTGDTRAALLSMRDRIEHPQFKELITNMEVNLRYCSDFSVLVIGSKRTLREYLKNAGERTGMLREALVSMALLLGMALLVLWIVGGMVNMSVYEILWGTLPGKIGMGAMVIIILLFYRQADSVHE